MNDILPIPADAYAQHLWRPSAAINPERLEYLWALAEKIGVSSIVPESLRGERKGSAFEPFPPEVVVANVFAVIEQADRINFSPFALLQGASLVRGKLMFEGKIVAAILDQNFGIELYQEFTGEAGTLDRRIFLSDQPLPDGTALQPGLKIKGVRIIDGSVAEWKTDGNNSPWRPARFDAMLVYRGTREFARLHKSAAIMGIIADDEIEAIALERRAQLATDATPINERFKAVPTGGFSAHNVAKQLEHSPSVEMERVDPTTGEVIEQNTGAQPEARASTTSPGQEAKRSAEQGQKAEASDRPSSRDDGGAGERVSDGDSRPQNTSSPSSTSEGDGGDAVPAPHARVSADTWRSYHSALARMMSKENVLKAHDKFWDGKGIRITHPDDIQLGKDIKENHIHRAEGKIPAGEVAKAIDGWIQDTTKEQEL